MNHPRHHHHHHHHHDHDHDHVTLPCSYVLRTGRSGPMMTIFHAKFNSARGRCSTAAFLTGPEAHAMLPGVAPFDTQRNRNNLRVMFGNVKNT